MSHASDGMAGVATPPSIAAIVNEWAMAEVVPMVDRWEAAQHCPVELIGRLGELGVLQACDPQLPGGFANKVALARALGGTRSLGIAATVLNHINIPMALLRHGRPSLRRTFLAPMGSGVLCGAAAITEPHGGSDVVGSTATTVTCDADWVTVDGTKWFVLNAGIADVFLVLGRSAPTPGALSLTFVAVPADTPGVIVRRIATTGLHTATIGEVHFERCRVPREYVVGDLHRGAGLLPEALTEERLLCAVAVLALARAAFDETTRYAAGRRYASGKLSDLQAVRHRLAELFTALAVTDAFLDSVAAEHIGRRPGVRAAVPMAKLNCTETACDVLEKCLQLCGGRGLLETNWLTRAYRDVLASTIAAGTSDVMRHTIAQQLGW